MYIKTRARGRGEGRHAKVERSCVWRVGKSSRSARGVLGLCRATRRAGNPAEVRSEQLSRMTSPLHVSLHRCGNAGRQHRNFSGARQNTPIHLKISRQGASSGPGTRGALRVRRDPYLSSAARHPSINRGRPCAAFDHYLPQSGLQWHDAALATMHQAMKIMEGGMYALSALEWGLRSSKTIYKSNFGVTLVGTVSKKHRSCSNAAPVQTPTNKSCMERRQGKAVRKRKHYQSQSDSCFSRTSL